MLLAELLAVSERVAGTRSRLAKTDALAECLRRLDASEIALGVAYLSGDTRQGRIGIGYATMKDALAATPASAPQLTLAHVDEALTRLAQIRGEGSAGGRARLIAEFFARATFPQSPKPGSPKGKQGLRDCGKAARTHRRRSHTLRPELRRFCDGVEHDPFERALTQLAEQQPRDKILLGRGRAREKLCEQA